MGGSKKLLMTAVVVLAVVAIAVRVPAIRKFVFNEQG